MAGVDDVSNGEAMLHEGFTVGILMQEPNLDETKTVLENVQDGVAGARASERHKPATGYRDRVRPEVKRCRRAQRRHDRVIADGREQRRRRRHALRPRGDEQAGSRAEAAGKRQCRDRTCKQPSPWASWGDQGGVRAPGSHVDSVRWRTGAGKGQSLAEGTFVVRALAPCPSPAATGDDAESQGRRGPRHTADARDHHRARTDCARGLPWR